MTESKSGDGAQQVGVSEVGAGFAATFREMREQQQAERSASPVTIWQSGWTFGGVRHTFSITKDALRYRRNDVPGEVEILPDGFEPLPASLRVGTLALLAGVVEVVAARSAAAHRVHLIATADAFREANLALEADEAPPVQDVPSLVGVLVRVLRERREYAQSYKNLATVNEMQDEALPDLNAAVHEAGEPGGDLIVVAATRAIRRMLSDVATSRLESGSAYDDLRKALEEVGETGPGRVYTNAARALRLLCSEVEKAKNTWGMQAQNEDLSEALTEAGEKEAGCLPVLAARTIRRLVAGRAPTRKDPFKVLGLAGSDPDGRIAYVASVEDKIIFHAQDGDRPELRALDREPLAPVLAKLCRLFNDAENAEHAESILATTTAQLEEAVFPARQTGETVLGCVQRLVDEEVRRHVEAYTAGKAGALHAEAVAVLDALPGVLAAERESTLAAVAQARASLGASTKEIARLLDGTPWAGSLEDLRRMVASAAASLESIPFTPHVDGSEGGEAPKVVEPVPVPKRHRVTTGSSKTVCGVQLLKPITGPSWCADEIDGVIVRWSTDGARVTCLQCIAEDAAQVQAAESSTKAPSVASAPLDPAKMDPVFDWAREVAGERHCLATFSGCAAAGFIRRATTRARWIGFTEEKVEEGSSSEVDAMTWVQMKLREKLARLVLEKSAPLGAKPGTVEIHTAPSAGFEATRAAIAASFPTHDENTTGSSR